ncbi:ABC transporter permease [Sulfurimonas sp.]|uniref:ABC transporter permease n=1 Tax=Sulfurimonas sp. TaxID=2022749 RepID=UPI0025E1A7F7|nr:ABC transporter permease [Sulfurimonas sp.]
MLSAMIKKEFLLVLRDKHALLALFVMPAIFILIMSVAMRDQFSTNTIEFTVYAQDSDKTQISKKIISDIKEDKNFTLVSHKTEAQFLAYIPKNYSKDTNKKIELVVNKSLKSDQIEIFKSMLSKHLLSARFTSMAETLKKYSPETSKILSSINISNENLYKVKYNDLKSMPNSTQQSVPSWIVFGMFFIIIPMSTIYVNERKQNTLARLNSMNVSILWMSISKSIPYLVINQIQVAIMLGVGIFLVPMFNTSALEINGSLGAIATISLALSVSAIGVSTLIAVSASSSEQATTIGGIFNILLGAIGGVMVPKYIMPESMQRISEFSPMSWGLDGFLDIFLKSANASMILEDALKLFVFGIISLIISMIILRIRINKGL